jgi:hypothetical protein
VHPDVRRWDKKEDVVRTDQEGFTLLDSGAAERIAAS